MAIFLVSLRWLADARHWHTGQDQSATITTGKSSEENATSETSGGAVAEAVSPPLEEKGKSESKDGVASGGAAAVLGIAKSEVDELLSECGEAAGRALLGLIYRFSAMESELNDLRSMIEGGATMTVHQSFAAPLPPAKSSTVLEQVFQSNLALWASIDQ